MKLKESCTKLACFSQRRADFPEDGSGHANDMDAFRESGQSQLRAMISDGHGVDWVAVLQKANELQEQEQDRLRRHEHRNRLKRQKRALERRKQYDKAGSFSTNMLTYRIRPDSEEKKQEGEKMDMGLLLSLSDRKRYRYGGRRGSTYSSLDYASFGSSSSATDGNSQGFSSTG